jgi:hypothetical protein
MTAKPGPRKNNNTKTAQLDTANTANITNITKAKAAQPGPVKTARAKAKAKATTSVKSTVRKINQDDSDDDDSYTPEGCGESEDDCDSEDDTDDKDNTEDEAGILKAKTARLITFPMSTDGHGYVLPSNIRRCTAEELQSELVPDIAEHVLLRAAGSTGICDASREKLFYDASFRQEARLLLFQRTKLEIHNLTPFHHLPEVPDNVRNLILRYKKYIYVQFSYRPQLSF